MGTSYLPLFALLEVAHLAQRLHPKRVRNLCHLLDGNEILQMLLDVLGCTWAAVVAQAVDYG